MGVKERKEREKNLRRRAILQAAKKVFYKNGFSNTRLEDIADACELSAGTIYLYFKSKEEIYVSLLFESMELFANEIEKINNKNLSAANKVELVWNYFYKFYRKNPELFRIIMFINNEKLRESISDDIIKKINQISSKNFLLFSEILREGLIRKEEKKESLLNLSFILWSIFIGLVYFYETRENLGLRTNFLSLHKKSFDIIRRGLLEK